MILFTSVFLNLNRLNVALPGGAREGGRGRVVAISVSAGEEKEGCVAADSCLSTGERKKVRFLLP